MGGTCSTCGVEEKCSQGIVVEHEGGRTLARLMFRWENNIKMVWHGLKSSACVQVQVAGSFKCSEILD